LRAGAFGFAGAGGREAGASDEAEVVWVTGFFSWARGTAAAAGLSDFGVAGFGVAGFSATGLGAVARGVAGCTGAAFAGVAFAGAGFALPDVRAAFAGARLVPAGSRVARSSSVSNGNSSSTPFGRTITVLPLIDTTRADVPGSMPRL